MEAWIVADIEALASEYSNASGTVTEEKDEHAVAGFVRTRWQRDDRINRRLTTPATACNPKASGTVSEEKDEKTLSRFERGFIKDFDMRPALRLCFLRGSHHRLGVEIKASVRALLGVVERTFNECSVEGSSEDRNQSLFVAS